MRIDSIRVGRLALLLALSGMGVLVISGWRAAEALPATVGLMTTSAASMVAVGNMFLVFREKDRGNDKQALIGFIMSGATLLIGVLPWMGVD